MKKKKDIFKKHAMVLVDPYNKIKSNLTQGTITGIIVKVHPFSCDIVSMQTMDLLNVKKKYLVNIDAVHSEEAEQKITIVRDTKPLFTNADILIMKNKVNKYDELNTPYMHGIISKMESQIISTTSIKLIQGAKIDSDEYNTINTLINSQCKDSIYENYEDAMKIQEHIKKYSHLLEKTLADFKAKQAIESVEKMISDFVDSDPPYEEYVKLINHMVVTAPHPDAYKLSILNLCYKASPQAIEWIKNIIALNNNIGVAEKLELFGMVEAMMNPDNYPNTSMNMDDYNYGDDEYGYNNPD